MIKDRVIVQSYKYDRSFHYSWEANVLSDDGNLIITYSAPGYIFTHPRMGVRSNMERAQISFFWRDTSYNVNANFTLRGDLRNFYCNISMPCQFKNKTISWVDLDLDLRVYDDYKYTILDEDEFEEHGILYRYPDALKLQARNALNDLIARVEKRLFPFDGTVTKWLELARS